MPKTTVTTELRAGVAGAGVFGAYHAQKYADAAGARLVATYDPDVARARALADQYGATAYEDYDAFLSAVDVVAIAAPATLHASLGRAALAAGRHVYMEKPLALDVRDAAALVDMAARQDLVLHVGHQERRVLHTWGLADPGDPPKHLEFVRVGPASGRGEDVSATFDLMIHDLDMAASFGFGAPIRVDAAGCAHEVVAAVEFEGGRSASFVTSRRAPERRREAVFTYGDGEIRIDFASRGAASTRNAAGNVCGSFAPAPTDPLGDNVVDFINAVRGAPNHGVEGRAAVQAVAIAEAIERARLERRARLDYAGAVLAANANGVDRGLRHSVRGAA